MNAKPPVRSNKMNRIISIILALGLVLIMAAECLGLNFSVRLSGGLGFLAPAEINRTVQEWAEWQKRETESHKSWSFLGGETARLKSDIEFEAEMLVSLHSRFAISLVTGFLFGEIDQKNIMLSIQKNTGTFNVVRPFQVSAIPALVSGTYLIPLFPKLKLYLKGGAGVMWAKEVSREGSKKLDADKYSYPLAQNAKAYGTMATGALGMTFETEPGLGFFLEGTYRHAKVGGLKGEDSSGESGNLYFFEEYDPSLEFWQAKRLILTEMPSGENIRSAKEAEIDFSGFSIKIGIIIKF